MPHAEGNLSSGSERDLVAAARRGDADAFAELVRRLEGRVAATVVGMLGPGPDAEDVGQETFVRLYRSLGRFRGDSSLASYITRIAINLCRNARRHRTRRAEVFSAADPQAVDNLPAPASEVEALPERDLVRRALDKLGPDDREVIVLRLIDGYSTRETANILELPEGTVTSRLARAQMKLRDVLRPLLKEAS